MRASSALQKLCVLALASAVSPGRQRPLANQRFRVQGAALSIPSPVGLLNASSDLDGPSADGVGGATLRDDLGALVDRTAVVAPASIAAVASDRPKLWPRGRQRLASNRTGEGVDRGALLASIQIRHGAHVSKSSARESISSRQSTNSWALDEFTIYYWTFVVLATLLLLGSYKVWALITQTNEKDQSLWILVDPSAVFKDRELTNNFWCFYLIVACGQARVHYMRSIPVHLVGIVATLLGCCQLLTIYLIVHDINPASTPVTTKESLPPWKESPWTVNTMKWIQVVFITTALVKEIGQGMHLFSAGLTINQSRLSVPRFCVLYMPIMQYLVTMAVLYGGVSIILSFQAVPDIIYSSMAITFIANVDDTLYEFFEQAFDIDADFVIDHTHDDHDGDSCGESTLESLNDVMRKSELVRERGDLELPLWYGPVRKFAVLFPVAFAFWLIGRAWYTGLLPTMYVRSLEEELGVSS